MSTLGYDGKPIHKNDRIVLHPNSGMWETSKYGTVIECKKDLVFVRLDGITKPYCTVPHNMRRLNITSPITSKPKKKTKKPIIVIPSD